jgi:SAM-dependent methyltransferase
VGVDFSRGMLAQATIGARQAGLARIRWVQADASALPFRAGLFDTVTCAYALYELKGPARGAMLDEVARILSSAGWFLAMEHEVPERPLPRFLFFLRMAVIGAEGARAFLGGEVHELGRIFHHVVREVIPPGKSQLLMGANPSRRPESSSGSGAETEEASARGDR